MQCTGHIIVNGEKILVLVRNRKYGREFKIRESGKDGQYFEEEGQALALPWWKSELKRLKAGETITL